MNHHASSSVRGHTVKPREPPLFLTIERVPSSSTSNRAKWLPTNARCLGLAESQATCLREVSCRSCEVIVRWGQRGFCCDERAAGDNQIGLAMNLPAYSQNVNRLLREVVHGVRRVLAQDIGVDLSRLDRAVAKLFLNEADVVL